MPKSTNTNLFEERLHRHLDELRWLYMELYNNGDMFAELCDHLCQFFNERDKDLKATDCLREQNPNWYPF